MNNFKILRIKGYPIGYPLIRNILKLFIKVTLQIGICYIDVSISNPSSCKTRSSAIIIIPNLYVVFIHIINYFSIYNFKFG